MITHKNNIMINLIQIINNLQIIKINLIKTITNIIDNKTQINYLILIIMIHGLEVVAVYNNLHKIFLKVIELIQINKVILILGLVVEVLVFNNHNHKKEKLI
jgi:hypothetical protein